MGDVRNLAKENTRGGFARLNAVARAERAANPNTLYLFNGDMLSPSLASGFDKGQNTIDFTNLVPFDLAVPGNHEFDFGPENFMEKMKASKYPWAAITITNDDGSAVEGLGGGSASQPQQCGNAAEHKAKAARGEKRLRRRGQGHAGDSRTGIDGLCAGRP